MLSGSISDNGKAPYYHDAKIWQVGFFTLNNCATNISLALMMMYSYYAQNVLGLAAGIIGLISTCTRVFDALINPFAGLLVDKTNGRFGKIRPFMLLGNITIWVCLTMIFYTPQDWPAGVKYGYTTAFYFLYIIGYTSQTICTKAGQSILTNNPKKRPFFSGFDQLFTSLAFATIPLLITTVLARKYSSGEYAGNAGMINPEMWKEAVLILGSISLAMTFLAIAGVRKKDRREHFASFPIQKIRFRDYFDIILHNRPVQILSISAALNKLGLLLANGTTTYVFANLLLKSELQGIFSVASLISVVGSSIIGVYISRKFGLKRAFLLGSWVSMALLVAMFIVRPNPQAPIVFLGLLLLQKCAIDICNASVIPMIADCADYEIYRSGKFIPGIVSAVNAFVDRLISSLSAVIQGAALTLAGVGSLRIIPNQPVSSHFNFSILICFCIIPAFCHAIMIILMKFYHLDKRKMEEIQSQVFKQNEHSLH